jgi:hypothetical protein
VPLGDWMGGWVEDEMDGHVWSIAALVVIGLTEVDASFRVMKCLINPTGFKSLLLLVFEIDLPCRFLYHLKIFTMPSPFFTFSPSLSSSPPASPSRYHPQSSPPAYIQSPADGRAA